MKYIPRGSEKYFSLLCKYKDKQKNGEDVKIVVHYDPDLDGLIAGRLVQRQLTRLGLPSMYYINANRKHGFYFTDAQLEELKGGLIVGVDFAISRAEIERVVEKGVDIVVIDHHSIFDSYIEVEKDGKKGLLINNQYDFEPAEYRYLSGAGVVHYVQEYVMSQISNEEEDTESMGLVGISLLSDVRPLGSTDATRFLNKTYTLDTAYFQYIMSLVIDDTYKRFDSAGKPRMHRNFIEYRLAPHLNAMFRMDKGVDAIRLLNGDIALYNEYMDTGRIYAYRKIQNSITQALMEQSEVEDIGSLQIVKVEEEKVLAAVEMDIPSVSNFIGLACSRMMSDTKTTFLYVVDKDGVFLRGSVRGLKEGVDYLKIFREVGVDCEGHAGAFGVMSWDVDIENRHRLASRIEEGEAELGGGSVRNVIKVMDLKMFLKETKKVAIHNAYVSDRDRYYLKYVGMDIREVQKGKIREYIINGIPIPCFDAGITMENGYIIPVLGKGEHVELTLKRIEK